MKQLFTFEIYLDDTAPMVQASCAYAPKWQDLFTKRIAWVVLFAYSLMLCKPAMPLLSDAMAHTFWESQHMLTVHEVNGTFHVHYETEKSGNKTENNKQAGSNKVMTEDDLYTSSEVTCFLSVHIQDQCSYMPAKSRCSTFDACVNYPPPKV